VCGGRLETVVSEEFLPVELPDTPAGTSSSPPDFVLGDLDLPAPTASRPAAVEDGGGRPRHRRRHSSAARTSAASRPTFMRLTDPVLRWCPLALLAFAPLAWGSVESWSEMVVVTGSCAIGAVWLLRVLLYPDCCAADRSAGGHIGSWSAGLHTPLIAVLGVGVVQLLPLGPLVAALSPIGAEIQRQAGLGGGALTFSMAPQETLRALAQFAGHALLFFAVLEGLHGREDVRRFTMAFVILGFAHALGGILWHYQDSGHIYWDTTMRENPFGPYVNRNHFACLMGMTVPLGIGFLLSIGHRRKMDPRDPESPLMHPATARVAESGPKRFLVGFAVAVMAGALGLSLSRGGLVSTFVALAVLAAGVGAMRLTRSHLWMLGTAIAGAFAFTFWLVAQPLLSRLGSVADPASMTTRVAMWVDTLHMAGDYPLFGSGFGTFAETYPGHQTALTTFRVTAAHSDWVQLLAEGGLAGTLAVLAVVATYAAAALRRLVRRRDREAIFLSLGGLGGLLAFLLHSFVEFNAHIPANALWFTVLAALTLKTLSNRVESATEARAPDIVLQGRMY
jgi:O-antigen ligase